MFCFNVGAIKVARIPESLSPAVDPFTFLVDFPSDGIERNRAWLEPFFYDNEQKKLILSGGGWLVKTPSHNILIEACAGNHKPRPTFERGHMLNTPWLERLAEAGCRPEEIDFVLCTHLHVDHVGWFTRLENGNWIPTFPQARYLIDALEYDNWNPKTRWLPPLGINANCFEDSVTPVMDAGLMTLIAPPHRVADGIVIVPARGHTLGHVVITVENGPDCAIFVGDAMHTPLQILYPQSITYSCEDPAATVATHHALLAECADKRKLFVPTHFPDPYSAVRIVRHDEGFAFTHKDGGDVPGLQAVLRHKAVWP